MLFQIAKAEIFESAGSELSLRNLAKHFETTVDTVKSYVDAFEACYLIVSCPYFTFSERKSLVRSKKYYPIDNGLREAITKSGEDHGKRFEMFIFHALRKENTNSLLLERKTREVDLLSKRMRESNQFK